MTGKNNLKKIDPILETAIKHWKYVTPIVACPSNEKEFDALVARLDDLLDIVGENENHPLMSLVDIVSDLISAYEAEHYPIKEAKGIDVLRYLMEAHNLRQDDLSEIGSQGVISEILKGKRKLNVRQIKLLAKRFHVSPETFIDK